MGYECVWEEDTFSDIKEELIRENKKYWANKDNITQGDKWIYVYHGMSASQFDWAVRENVVAKGLQEKTHLPITSVIDGYGRVLPEGLDESFGIMDSVHLFYSKYVNEQSAKTIDETAMALANMTYQDKDKMLQMEYRGIKFGDELYDYLIAKVHDKNVLSFNIFDISLEQYAHYIRNTLSMIDHTFEIFLQKRPAYVITTEKIHLKRLFGDIARTFGAEEIIILTDWPEVLVRVPFGRPQGKKVLISDCMESVVGHYIKYEKLDTERTNNLFVIENTAGTDTFDLSVQLGLPKQNKNVFILPHAFVDAPRESNRLHFYHDYLDWFLNTIEIIKKIPNVNWIIKDHPETVYYKQNEYIKRVFIENKTPNMYWCDSHVSGLLIKEFADCIVTCGGEAALEYWAYGIPTVTTAETYFSRQAISYNIKSPKEYEETLKNISRLNKPTEGSQKKAHKILAAMKKMSNCEIQDELVALLLSVRKIQRSSYCQGENFDHVSVFCEGYVKLLEQGAIEKSCIYQMKNVCDVV